MNFLQNYIIIGFIRRFFILIHAKVCINKKDILFSKSIFYCCFENTIKYATYLRFIKCQVFILFIIMLVSTKKLFEKCYCKYGIAAVNVFTMEQVLGLFAAADASEAPFIVQTSPVARDYSSSEMLLAMIDAASKLYPKTVYAIHVDHGVEEHVYDAIDSKRYTSVMIDASHEDFDKNVAKLFSMLINLVLPSKQN